MERTLLDDFLKIYHSMPCNIIYNSCIECKNENLCKTLYKVLLSMRKFYLSWDLSPTLPKPLAELRKPL